MKSHVLFLSLNVGQKELKRQTYSTCEKSRPWMRVLGFSLTKLIGSAGSSDFERSRTTTIDFLTKAADLIARVSAHISGQ